MAGKNLEYNKIALGRTPPPPLPPPKIPPAIRARFPELAAAWEEYDLAWANWVKGRVESGSL